MQKKYFRSIVLLGLAAVGTVAFSAPFLSWPFSAPIVENEAYLPAASKGDIFFENSSSKFKGYDGTNWMTLSGSGGGSGTLNIVSKTSSYTVGSSDDMVLGNASSAAFTLTLPAAAANSGRVLIFKKTDGTFNTVTIDPNGSETIDGQTTTTLNTQDEALKIVSNGTNWSVLGRYIPSVWTDAGTIGITGTTSNPTKGTASVDKIMWKRAGSEVHIRLEYQQNSTGGTAGSGDYKFAMPSGIAIDSTKVTFGTVVGATSSGVGSRLGSGGAVVLSTATGTGWIIPWDANNFRIVVSSNVSNGFASLSSAWYNMNATNGVSYSADFVIPVSGWNE